MKQPADAEIVYLPERDAHHLAYKGMTAVVPNLWTAQYGPFTVDWKRFHADPKKAIVFRGGPSLADLHDMQKSQDFPSPTPPASR